MKLFTYVLLVLALLVILNQSTPESGQSQVFNSITGEWEYVKPSPSQ